jgi:hypothetical protein
MNSHPDFSSPVTFSADISLSLAVAAHAGTSFSPEKRGDSVVTDYCAELASFYSDLLKHVSGSSIETLNSEFARFREGFSKRYRAYLYSRSRVVSTMIAGPSNFPVARMEKRNSISHKRLCELLDFKKAARNAILRTLHPEARPIMAGDADAVERLTAEIAEAEALQERMKDANKLIRSKWSEGTESVVFGLVALGFSEANAREMITPGRFGGHGFPSFTLTNKAANLRRLKQRLASVSKAKATPTTELEGSNARLVDCPAENRVRLFFGAIPAREIREQMKSNGFRWSPTIGAWQAYRNFHSCTLAKKLAGLVPESVASAA